LKPVRWIGSSLRDLRSFPDDVRRNIGFALQFAQEGGKYPMAKPLKGFGGAGVLEILADRAGDTFRAVYTVRFADSVYVLHAFMKKSKRGISTPVKEIELIKARLARAERDYVERLTEQAYEDDKAE
jgi:phage-related protein